MYIGARTLHFVSGRIEIFRTLFFDFAFPAHNAADIDDIRISQSRKLPRGVSASLTAPAVNENLLILIFQNALGSRFADRLVRKEYGTGNMTGIVLVGTADIDKDKIRFRFHKFCRIVHRNRCELIRRFFVAFFCKT